MWQYSMFDKTYTVYCTWKMNYCLIIKSAVIFFVIVYCKIQLGQINMPN